MQEIVLTSPKSAHKSMKEQFESVSSYIVDYLWDQPAIYCGTYKSTMKAHSSVPGSISARLTLTRSSSMYASSFTLMRRIRSLCFRIISASLLNGIQKAVWMKKFSTR